jgi:DNA-binding NtrC family response regulator
VRWIAATNADLFASDCGFRDDLLRRLAGYVARIPPLRARREDLGALTAFLLADAGVTAASMTVAAARQLFGGAFPGNVRQLRATLRSAALLAAGSPIDVQHLPVERAVQPVAAPTPVEAAAKRAEPPTAAELEAALRSTGGNIVRTAELFSTHPRQIYRWIEKHALVLDDFRPPDAGNPFDAKR